MHAAAPVPPGRRRGDVVGVGVAAGAEHLAEDACAPRPRACSHSSRISTAAPSPMTKPSRSTSNGRDMPLVDSAVMLANPAIDVTVAGASLPPVTTASHRPQRDQPGGVADGVGAGGARRADRLVGPLQAVAHRDRRTAGVGHHHRHEERRHPPLTLVDADLDLLLERLETADARWRRSCRSGPGRRRCRRPGRTPRRPRRWRTARPGRRAGPPWGWSYHGDGSQSARRIERVGGSPCARW